MFSNTQLIDDELLQTQPMQNNLLSEFERDEDEKMNFSFTADGGFGGIGGLGGNETSINTAAKYPQAQNDSFSKSPMMISDFDDELIGAVPAPPKPVLVQQQS